MTQQPELQSTRTKYDGWLVVFPRGRADGYFEVAEKHENGTVTFWTRNMGHCGTLKPDVETKPVTRCVERERVELIKRGIQRGIELSQIQYDLAKSSS